jgi:preprotein translocase subunit SecG
MYKIVLILHIVVAISLIGMILVQRGRSGGLVEALGGVESIFGTKTSALLVKLTVIFTVVFFLTSISLAYLYKQKAQKQDKSLLEVEQQVDEKTE